METAPTILAILAYVAWAFAIIVPSVAYIMSSSDVANQAGGQKIFRTIAVAQLLGLGIVGGALFAISCVLV